MTSAAPFTAVQTESNDLAWFEIERSIIEAAGGRVIVQRAADQDERAALLQDAQCVLVSGASIDEALLDRCPNLELIIRYGVGLDTVDIPAATARGVLIAHYPDFCQPEVANHALMLLLAVARKLPQHDRAIRAGNFRGVPFPHCAPLTHEVLGLVSFGNIAQQMAKRARALDMHVLAYDPYVEDGVFDFHGVERAETFEDLLRGSDHISIHAPLTAQTFHMFSREQFAMMKPTSIIVNTARGPIIDEPALIEALREGQIGGAGLDVFEVEPLPADSPLLAFENVVLTPHSAFYSEFSNRHIKERVGQTVVDYMNGRWPTAAALPNRDAIIPRRPLQ